LQAQASAEAIQNMEKEVSTLETMIKTHNNQEAVLSIRTKKAK
jgi:chaperonin cofactor prefoldin